MFTLVRPLLATSLLLLLAACSGTGSKSPSDTVVAPPIDVPVQPIIDEIEPLLLAEELQALIAPNSGSSGLLADVDRKLEGEAGQQDIDKGVVTFIWQVPEESLPGYDPLQATKFVEQVNAKLHSRLRKDAAFNYGMQAKLSRWAVSENNKLLVIVAKSAQPKLNELQAIILDELYLPSSSSSSSNILNERLLDSWLAVFMDRKVGFRARLQQRP